MILLLVIIYLTFISLGLPDSIFGVAWPVMHIDLNVKLSFGTVYVIIVAFCTSLTSFFAGSIIRKLGTGKITFISVLLTVVGLVVMGISHNIVLSIVGSVCLGIGAGAIDTSLNNYVSLHYKASQMNWLHCFWGLGATLSPLIMSAFLGHNWRNGYFTIAAIQLVIAAFLFFALPLWKKYDKPTTFVPLNCSQSEEQGAKENCQRIADGKTFEDKSLKENDINEQKSCIKENGKVDEEKDRNYTDGQSRQKKLLIWQIIKIRGVFLSMLSLGLYCSMECVIFNWGASYILMTKLSDAPTAARWISFFYGGMMTGRLLAGFLSYKLNDKSLIRVGMGVALVGIVFLVLPIGNYSLFGLLLMGIGFGPVFPSTIHLTPYRFGVTYSADITGFQMSVGYIVGWCAQLVFGYVATATTFAFLPYFLLGLAIAQLTVTELLNSIVAKKKLFE